MRICFYVELGDNDNKMVAEMIEPLGAAFKLPEPDVGAKEHGVDKIDYFTVELFAKVEN